MSTYLQSHKERKNCIYLSLYIGNISKQYISLHICLLTYSHIKKETKPTKINLPNKVFVSIVSRFLLKVDYIRRIHIISRRTL